MMWIHEYQNWTNFTWDDASLSLKLAEARHLHGRLLGHMAALGFNHQQEAMLCVTTAEVVKSSMIEGENLNPEEVRSSIARRLGLDVAGLVESSRSVDGVVEMMLDATQQYRELLTEDRLCAWHAALFPTGYNGIHKITTASWRDDSAGPMQVVSGPIGREVVHFEAPAVGRLDQEIKKFLTWFNGEQQIDPVLKAGIAHLWFVTIHPFEDGNGRIARAILDMALARADGLAERYYSLSTQIERERKDYYSQLEKQQRAKQDITAWLEWFLGAFCRSIQNAENTLQHIIFKAKLWQQLNQNPVNSRQRLVINRMLGDNFVGYINTSKYAKLAKCSNDTALRDIQDLKQRGVLLQNDGKGRSTSYRLA